MDDKVNYALVGAFVLVLGAALIAGVLWLAAGVSGRRQFDPYDSIIAESVAGLNIDAPVKYLGVDVGKVSQIAVDPQNSSQVRLRLLIERGTPVRRDTEAVLKTQGLTGIAYVELGGGSPASPPLIAGEDGVVPVIRSKPSLSARIEDVLGGVLTNLDRLAGNLNAVLDVDNRSALAQTLADTRTLMRALAQQQHAIGAGLADAARAAGSAASAAEQLGPTLDRIGAGAQALEKMADSARQASIAAGRTVDTATDAVWQFGRETLPETQRLLVELNQLASTLRRLVEQVQAQPSGLLLGGPTPAPGPGEKAPP